MNSGFPSEADIAKLPLRGIVAYAARIARRASSHLHSLEKSDLVQRVLESTERIIYDTNVRPHQAETLLKSAAGVMASLGESPSPESVLAALEIIDSAVCAINVAMACQIKNENPAQFQKFVNFAVRHAHCAAKRSCLLGNRTSAIDAATRDYHTLMHISERSLDPGLGEPIDIGPSGALGPLW